VDYFTPESPGSRVCPDCGVEKPLTEFTLNKRRPDGRGTYCRDCFNVRSRQHREKRATAERRALRRKRSVPSGHKYCPRCQQTLPLSSFGSNRSSRDGYTSYCRSCHNTVGRETKIRLYGGTREYHLRHRYGITVAEFDALVETQGGTCAVCPGKPEHVDHDHETGTVRGVLCFNCNQALGNVRDDPDILYGLVDYLARHGRAAENPPELFVVEHYIYRGLPVVELGDFHHAA
jgi:hypothetical protein